MKEYRQKEMKCLVVAYSLLLLLLCTKVFDEVDITQISKYEKVFSVFEGITVSSILYMLVLIGDMVISANHKDKLIGLFFIPRAGCTVFSRIKNNKISDMRFDNTDAIKKYKSIINDIPSKKFMRHKFENAKWYSIYKKNAEEPSIIQTQMDYLMCRDLNIETFEYLIVYFVCVVIFSDYIHWSWKFFLFLLFMLVVTNLSTHNKMNRFVNTVIAVDLSIGKGE